MFHVLQFRSNMPKVCKYIHSCVLVLNLNTNPSQIAKCSVYEIVYFLCLM
jgi:hypothetical protein